MQPKIDIRKCVRRAIEAGSALAIKRQERPPPQERSLFTLGPSLEFAERCYDIATAEYAPNVPRAIVARQVLTPLDLERTYGLTEGNIFHGDLNLKQLFFMRSSNFSRDCRTGFVKIQKILSSGAKAHSGLSPGLLNIVR